jgi:(p)ppGpp synthase/HD superfamily hydrolase
MLLHDLLEDTKCTPLEIEKRFGPRVLQLVEALTFDDSIRDYQLRWKGPIAKMVAIGRDACIMKTVDMHDNLLYLGLLGPKTNFEHTIWKHRFVLQSFTPILKNDPLFRAYSSSFEQEAEKSAKTYGKPST